MLQFNFTPFPLLSTARLQLRQLTLDDANEIFSLRSDEKVNEFVDRPRAVVIDDAINFINKINNFLNNNESIYWAITLKSDEWSGHLEWPDQLIGTICLWNLSKENASAEIGYELLPQHQGKGIMQEAFVKVVEYGFDVMKLRLIEARTHAGNQRSSKILERNGFVRDEEAEEKNKEHLNGEVIYSLAASGERDQLR